MPSQSESEAAVAWDDDRCPWSQNSDGSHCAHADTHDMCDWCGAHWGEGGKMTVPIERVEAERKRCADAIRAAAAPWNKGTATRNVLDRVLREVEEGGHG